MKHVVLFSGGVGSWAAAKRVAEKHGTDDLTLLFTDTKSEDEDTYRFLKEGAENVGGELAWIAEGRTVWEVFNSEGMMGSTRADLCSRILKREQSRGWIEKNCDPEDSVIYVGIDWSEAHRFRKMQKAWEPYTVEAPLTEAPYLTKRDMITWAETEGIREQDLYRENFSHANCAGACVKAGQGAWAHLLRMRPETYRYHEEKEEDFRDRTGKDVSILRERVTEWQLRPKGHGLDPDYDQEAIELWERENSGPQQVWQRMSVSKPLTLTALRERVEAEEPIEADWGGCGCFTGEDV